MATNCGECGGKGTIRNVVCHHCGGFGICPEYGAPNCTRPKMCPYPS